MRKRKFNLCLSLLLTFGIAVSQLSPIAAQQDTSSDLPAENTQVEQLNNDAEAENTETPKDSEVQDGTVPQETETPPVTETVTESEDPETTVTPESYGMQTIHRSENDVTVYATFDSTSGLPKDAVLNVKEIKKGGNQYSQCLQQADAVTEGEVTFARFFDIYFTDKDKDGEVVQPSYGTVTIEIKYDQAQKKEEQEDISVVHFPKTGGIEVIDNADSGNDDTSFQSVKLEATSFSIYGIVGNDQPVRVYTFYAPSSIENGNLKYEEYKYTDEAGNKVSTQYVANGSSLINPGNPIDGFEDYVFTGWYLGENNEIKPSETKAPFDTVLANVSKKEEFKVVAKYEKVQYATFFEDKDGTIVLGKIKIDNGKVNISDLPEVISPEKNQTFVGWKLGQNGEKVDFDENDDYQVKDNDPSPLMFYPIFSIAYTIEYKTGEGGSYVKPETFLENVNTEETTTIPHRTGYTFTGWFTEKDADGNGIGTKFEFKKPLTGNIILYAGWKADSTNYRISVWQQTTEGGDNYGYIGSQTLQESTGNRVVLPAAYTTFGNQSNQTVGDKQGISFVGFHYNEEKSQKEAIVNGDGSTTLNVYYDRNTITMIFKNHGNQSGRFYMPTSSTNGTLYGTDNGEDYYRIYKSTRGSTFYKDSGLTQRYTGQRFVVQDLSNVLVLQGLYGQAIKGDNPFTEHPWNNSADNRNISFLGEFVLFTNTNFVDYFTEGSGSTTIEFYKQNLENDEYPDMPSVTAKTSTGDFKFSNKFDGFEVVAYQKQSWNGWSEWTGTEAGKTTNISGTLRIRYRRNVHHVQFFNGMVNNPGEVFKESAYKYEASLDGIILPDVSKIFPGHPDDVDAYEFAGWFADPECTKLLLFREGEPTAAEKTIMNKYGIKTYTNVSKMPNSNVPAYAGWFRERFDVTFETKGGTLESGLADKVNVEYGKALPAEYFEPEGVQKEGETFLGWKNNKTGEFWSPVHGITEDTVLTAVWKKSGSFTVEYVNSEDDSKYTSLNTGTKYVDQSNVILPFLPSTPENKVFLGWRVRSNKNQADSDGTLYLPGETFPLDAGNQANNNGIVTVEAVFNSIKTTYLTYHYNDTSNPTLNRPIFDIAMNSNVTTNEGVTTSTPIKSLDDLEWSAPSGKVFKEWNTDPEGKGTTYKPGPATYAVNGDGKQNNFYAIWTDVYTVTIKKVVDGGFGDRNKEFGFKLNVTDEKGNLVSETSTLPNVASVSGNHTFELKHDGTLVIAVPKGYHVTVEETSGLEGYDTSVVVNDIKINNNANKGSSGDLEVVKNSEITFTNTKNSTVPTGIGDNNILIYLMMTIMGLGFAILYILQYRRKHIYY